MGVFVILAVCAN